MNRVRVLLLSGSRPSRTWRFAARAEQEAEAVQICGIAQTRTEKLSAIQQQLACPQFDCIPKGTGWWNRLGRAWNSLQNKLAETVLWFVHGCPARTGTQLISTPERLAKACSGQAWPFVEIAGLDDPGLNAFLRDATPDLIVLLGEAAAIPALGFEPRLGWMRAQAAGSHIRLSIDAADGSAPGICSLQVRAPRQAFDSPIGAALKRDLIVDDLFLQVLAALPEKSPRQAMGLAEGFAKQALEPYFAQVGPAEPPEPPGSRRWYRSSWSLVLETILLCSPVLVARNWFRRARGRYPVLILVHHLVSDRAHRMSMSTEAFWRQILFLCRHYQIVDLAHATELLHSGQSRAMAVALTFDDGYADNFISLRAVANEFDLPVTLFITTRPVENRQEFQHDVARGSRGAFALTWEQIRYWRQRGATFGSHTRNHIRCSLADSAMLEEEIAGSKLDMESRLGEAPRFFAFPYGNRQDLPEKAVKIAAANYPYFFSAYGGENMPRANFTAQHLVRKNAFPEPWELELELQSVFDLVDGVKRFLGMRRERHSVGQGAPSHPPCDAVALATGLQFKPESRILSDRPSPIHRAEPN